LLYLPQKDFLALMTNGPPQVPSQLFHSLTQLLSPLGITFGREGVRKFGLRSTPIASPSQDRFSLHDGGVTETTLGLTYAVAGRTFGNAHPRASYFSRV